MGDCGAEENASDEGVRSESELDPAGCSGELAKVDHPTKACAGGFRGITQESKDDLRVSCTDSRVAGRGETASSLNGVDLVSRAA